MPRVLTAAALCAALVVSAPVPTRADHDKTKGHEKKEAREERDDAGDPKVVFGDRDREAVHTYWTETYGRDKCPPGLAKKGNGCLPPGQAKKRYVVGQRLPPAIVIQPLPRPLVTRLGPAPAGYDYGVVDGDVVKLAVGTRMVVDAISALLR